MKLIKIKNLHKNYEFANEKHEVLKDIDLQIDNGEMVAIVGASGSGKSTLMNIIAGLDEITSGCYEFDSVDMVNASKDQRAELRNSNFGFIFQSYNLIPYLNCLENIKLPIHYRKYDPNTIDCTIKNLVEKFGLEYVSNNRPHELSGGQQQRVSICRALINNPSILIADEPTGALDHKNGLDVMEALREINERGTTVIIVTHDKEIAESCDRVITLNKGEIRSDESIASVSGKKNIVINPTRLNQPAYFLQRVIAVFNNLRYLYASSKSKLILSLLGVVIGIATVVSTMSIAESVKSDILSQFSRFGNDTIRASLESSKSNQFLTEAKLQQFQESNLFESISPYLSENKLTHDGENIAMYGVNESFSNLIGFDVKYGRFIKKTDVDHVTSVIVVNDHYNKILNGGRNSIGDKVVFDGMVFTIIGVISQSESPQKQLIAWIPYSTMMKKIRTSLNIDRFYFTMPKENKKSIDYINYLLGGSYRFWSDEEYEKTITSITNTFTSFILSIALISLLVGGSGIMNIMLASVNERYAEIGVRLAVGATKKDILEQFIIEALLITLVGGVIGLFISAFIVGVMDRLITDFQVSISIASLLIGCAFSILTGILFGYLPAKKAANLIPIKALSR